MTSPTTDTRSEASPRFGLIIIGDEILSGKRADKHLPKFIEILAARGLQLAWAQYLGDDPQRITDSLRRAFASGDVVFSCGGIGATPDDHTRQCAGKALGRSLVLHPEAQRLILERIQDTAREQGVPYEPERADNVHRLNMGVFPEGADIIPNPYNKIPGFSCKSGGTSGAGPSQAASAPSGGREPHAVGERGGIYFLPGFPVMAWPMAEWVLDTHYAAHFRAASQVEKSVILFGAMESTLTPLMEQIEAQHPDIKVFSLPSVDHPQWGRHIELGVKGAAAAVEAAYADLMTGLQAFDLRKGPELVR
jgi:molybdopterin-biosynthesis enzyme MoeA-like protein